MFHAISTSCVAPFHDAHCGTGLYVPSECDGKILAVPLHKCLVVLDKYRSPHEHRGSIAASYADVRLETLQRRQAKNPLSALIQPFNSIVVQILSDFQAEWGLQLPEPIRAYICDLSVAKEIRLAAFVAWMRWHAHAGKNCTWWTRWLQRLPNSSGVSLLRYASDKHLTQISQAHPALGNRCRQDRSKWASMCHDVITAEDTIWLQLPVMRPGTSAPWSHPVGATLSSATSGCIGCSGNNLTVITRRASNTCEGLVAEMCCCDDGVMKILPKCSKCLNRKLESSMERDLCCKLLFDWAHMIVSSRSFCLSDRDGNRLICLVPVADFANHSTNPNTTFVLSSVPCRDHGSLRASLVLRTRRPLTSGEEVLLNYGNDKSNFLLLSCYGFCLPGNLADRLPLGRRGVWGEHNDILHDLKYVDDVMQRVLLDLNPSFSCIFPDTDEQVILSALQQNCHMRRLSVAAISVGEGLSWAADIPICIPAVEGFVNPAAVEYAGRMRQLQAVRNRVDALSEQNIQALTIAGSAELPEQWCNAIMENSHLMACCRQVLDVLKRIWEVGM